MIKLSDNFDYDQKKLKDFYEESLKDTKFKELVEKLKISD